MNPLREIRAAISSVGVRRSRPPKEVPPAHGCPCCGYRTLPSRTMYDVCPVCLWEDDPNQAEQPDLSDGANGISLRQAQRVYEQIGAMDPLFMTKVRSPRMEEARDADWRPLPPHAGEPRA